MQRLQLNSPQRTLGWCHTRFRARLGCVFIYNNSIASKYMNLTKRMQYIRI